MAHLQGEKTIQPIFFGSEVNVCSEETVVGEFEVRYPIMCEWLQWSLRVLRKVYYSILIINFLETHCMKKTKNNIMLANCWKSAQYRAFFHNDNSLGF